MQGRNIFTVLDRMIEASGDPILTKDLESLKSSCEFTAPELMHTRWQQGMLILENDLGSPDDFTEEWQHKVANIWMARE